MDISEKDGGFDEYELTTIRVKARKLIGKAGFTRDDLEDIQQEIVLDILQRLPAYDPEKSSRHTFINDIADNKIAALIEERNAEKRDYRFTSGSLDDAKDDGDRAWESRINSVTAEDFPWNKGGALSDFDRFELRADIVQAFRGLPPNLQDICLRLMRDSAGVVAAETGIPKATVLYNLKKIRKHFEKSGLKNLF
ncbi:MAG TPA: sigma factor [bacterium]|nr:sigma factor [bacterium]